MNVGDNCADDEEDDGTGDECEAGGTLPGEMEDKEIDDGADGPDGFVGGEEEIVEEDFSGGLQGSTAASLMSRRSVAMPTMETSSRAAPAVSRFVCEFRKKKRKMASRTPPPRAVIRAIANPLA